MNLAVASFAHQTARPNDRKDRASGPRLKDCERPDRKHPRALIAEDDRETREMYAWRLRAAGWFVAEAEDSDEALAIAGTLRPSVIVMDIGMPGCGGLEVIARLSEDERTREIPVVICTGLSPLALPTPATHVRFDGFVVKPCRADALLELLEDLIRPDGSSSGA
jgi:CheY-like chemotaxis protein